MRSRNFSDLRRPATLSYFSLGPLQKRKIKNLFGPHVASDAGESFAALDDDALESFRDRAVARDAAAGSERSLKEKMFALMTPAGSEALGMSRMNFFGIGARMLRATMQEKGIASLEELLEIARDLGVKIIAYTMSMDAMGVAKNELADGLEYGRVATYMAEACRSKVTMFI